MSERGLPLPSLPSPSAIPGAPASMMVVLTTLEYDAPPALSTSPMLASSCFACPSTVSSMSFPVDGTRPMQPER